MSGMITRHQELVVYKRLSKPRWKYLRSAKTFPKEETYSLIDQIRRSSRSVCSNLAEAWRKRRYEATFVAKLCDSEGEAAETQTWIEFAVRCGYLERETAKELFVEYDEVLSMLVSMISRPKRWVLPSGQKPRDGR